MTNGTITKSELKYTNNVLPNDTQYKIYRKLSRIVADCKHHTCGTKKRLKAVAVNETRLESVSSSGGGGEIIIEPEMKGLIVECGASKTWEELKNKHHLFSYWVQCDANNGATVTITAQNLDGFLKIQREFSAKC